MEGVGFHFKFLSRALQLNLALLLATIGEVDEGGLLRAHLGVTQVQDGRELKERLRFESMNWNFEREPIITLYDDAVMKIIYLLGLELQHQSNYDLMRMLYFMANPAARAP